MKRKNKAAVLLRAAIVIGAVMLVVTGVTFAALQSQLAVLTGNIIQTATANLSLSKDGANYAASQTGYSFNSLVPGGQPAPNPGYPLYMKNTGTTALSVALAITKPITNPDAVDLSKVYLVMTPMAGGAAQRIALQDLISSAATGGTPVTQLARLAAGQSTGMSLQVAMDSDAFTGSGAAIGDIEFSFAATAVN